MIGTKLETSFCMEYGFLDLRQMGRGLRLGDDSMVQSLSSGPFLVALSVAK